MIDKIELLISILLDNAAREDERDDAAMDLGKFDDSRALDALSQIASNPDECETILDSCGESVAKILVRRGDYRKIIFDQLTSTAKRAAYSFIREVKPEWIEQYQLEKDKFLD